MSLAADLLEQAEHLSKRESKRPKQASLRRSVSAAYYALFHLLVSEATALVGSNLNQNGMQKVQRWFDHREMKKVCGIFSSPLAGNIGAVLGPAPVSADLLRVANHFIRLQDARHKADYDLCATFARVTAQQYIQLARDAFSSCANVRRTHEANVFALALLSSKLFDKQRP